MFEPAITLQTKVFDLKSQRVNSSVRGDASEPVSEPNTLTISHENAKNGKVSSAIILDDVKLVTAAINTNLTIGPSAALSSVSMPSAIRTMLKFQYNPLDGRDDIEAAVAVQAAQIVEFLGIPANIAKILNQET